MHLNGSGSRGEGNARQGSDTLIAVPMPAARRELRPVRHSRAGGNPEGQRGGVAISLLEDFMRLAYLSSSV